MEHNEREIIDYLNYAGEWDYTFIIPKNIRGKSIDFKDIYKSLPDDFESTKNQMKMLKFLIKVLEILNSVL